MLSEKNILKILGLSLLTLALIACQPGALVKKEPQPVAVDSVLFFEQKEISDPFLSSLSPENDREITLKTRLLPPSAPPPPDYREIDGFRIQVFAGLDSLNAYRIMTDLRSKIKDPVYLIRENGLFKVQIGDFPYRVDADNRNMVLRRKGFPGAWVVARKIRIARNDSTNGGSTQADSVDQASAEDEPLQEVASFRIQILVTSDETRARQKALELEQQFSQPAWYEAVDGLYKVYLGKFQNRNSADAILKKVRANGYPDAWLVY